METIYKHLLQGTIKDYDINSLSLSIQLTVSNQIELHYNTMKTHYKSNFLYPYFELIIDNIIKNNIDVAIDLRSLLNLLTKLYKGQQLLIKIKSIIKKYISIINIEELLIVAASNGTFGTFMFWLNTNNGKYKNIQDIPTYIQETLIISSIANPDDRLYNYLLENVISNNKIFFQTNKEKIHELIRSLASQTAIPTKYVLRRIKKLSEYISLVPYFSYLINIFNDHKILIQIYKHYYKTVTTFETIYTFVKKLLYNSDDIFYIELKNKLLSDEEKESVYLSLLIDNHILHNHTPNLIILNKLIIDNYKIIIDNLVKNYQIIHYNTDLLKLLTSNGLFNKYINDNFKLGIPPVINCFFFARFPEIQRSEILFYNSLINKIFLINKCLHYLRMFIKHRYKIKNLDKKTKTFNLLLEITNYKPNNKIPILRSGSITYQQNKQKFNNVPPRHLLPGELLSYNNFLLREKVDGILINNLPIGIFPYCDIINNYQVKAEYIEDLDLYLIFDIDIPNTSIIERYNILRGNHNYTFNSELNNINNLDDFINIVISERNNIERFLNENKDYPIKWYPKFATHFILDNFSSFYENIIKNIILEIDSNINNQLNYKLYNCDGLILSPINGDREIKIKPKSQMTIDLLYTNNKWIDRNNNEWSHIIKPTDIKKNGKIYRFKPIFENNLRFENIGYRFDKKKPNSYKIIDTIICLINYNWFEDLNTTYNYYYEYKKPIKSKNIINCLKAQTNLLINSIENIRPLINKNWLDLGCGKGKLISIIKKYNPKYYLGLDIDINQLVKANKNNNDDIYNFSPCDLSNNWNNTSNKWFNFLNNNIKYDYVIANFSLMHFCNDLFWEQLNNIVNSGSIFIFNLLTTENTIWNESDSFLKINNNIVTYKFEWTHKNIKTEPYISEQIINNYLQKYGWRTININKPNSNYKLLNLYSWWHVIKS